MFLLIVGGLVGWLILGQLWKKVIKPYFKREERTVRTSVVNLEEQRANQLDDN